MKKIVNWLKNNKRLVLVVGILLLVVFLALVLIRRKQESQIETPPTLEEESPILKEPTVYPSSGDVEMAGTYSSISLFFEDTIDLNTVRIASNPAKEFNITTLADSPKRVILNPLDVWEEGSYEIRVRKGVRNENGTKTLQNDVIIRYVVLPQTYDFIAPY